MDTNEAEAIYASIPGGSDLIAWFGHAPSFHDAEIVSFDLNRRSASKLVLHAWNMTSEVDNRGYFVLDRHAVVTFVLEDILDLELDGFSHQNVVFGLVLRRAPDRPDRSPFYWKDGSPDDFEIELEHCFGLSGKLRCCRVSVTFVPGKPDDARG
jgi:hypothetical protein